MPYFENKPLLNRDKSYDCDHYDFADFCICNPHDFLKTFLST